MAYIYDKNNIEVCTSDETSISFNLVSRRDITEIKLKAA